MPNHVIFFEVVGRDRAALRRFYRDLFGSSIRDVAGDIDYRTVTSGDAGSDYMSPLVGERRSRPTRRRSDGAPGDQPVDVAGPIRVRPSAGGRRPRVRPFAARRDRGDGVA
jgi:hypothetical protein